jgi:hypothetical protein
MSCWKINHCAVVLESFADIEIACTPCRTDTLSEFAEPSAEKVYVIPAGS